MGIDGSRFDGRMAQKTLNNPKVYSLFQQMRCKTMTQCMETCFFSDTGFSYTIFKYSLNCTTTDWKCIYLPFEQEVDWFIVTPVFA